MAIGTTNYPSSLDTASTLAEVADNATTNLTVAALIGDTTFTVTSTTGFPTTGVLTVESEKIAYTGATSTTFTGLTRAYDGSTAAGHANGTAVNLNELAMHHRVLRDAVIALETQLGAGANPAASGYVRLPNIAWLTARNAANSADLNLLQADANNNVAIGQAKLTTAQTELVLEQSGDTYGPVRLHLQNRIGSNGAVFEMDAASAAVGVVDFAFQPSGAAGVSRNVRCENRGGYAIVAAPEFQIGVASAPTLIVADSAARVVGQLQMAAGARLTFLGQAGAPTGAAAGDHWYDTTAKGHMVQDAAGAMGLRGLLYQSTADSTAIASTLAETAYSTSFQFPANSLTVGTVVKLRAWGLWSTTGTPTMTWKVRFNAAGNAYLATFGAVTAASGQSNRHFAIEALATVRAVGVSGTFVSYGTLETTTAASPAAPTINRSYNTGTVALDTTAAQTLQATATWSASSASNTTVVQGMTVEVMR